MSELIKLCAILVIVSVLCEGHTQSQDHHWDYMKFTQEWAPSKCIGVSTQTCRQLGKIVSSWIIHGLWPTKSHTEDPESCNKSDTFNIKNVQSIMPKLQKFWPNLLTPVTDALWEHEWSKHGTCGVTLPALGNQLKYFSKTLDLNRQYDMLSIFKRGGIAPRDQGYKVSAIIKALSRYGSAKIQCIHDKDQKKQFLVQMYICLDKTFNIIDCNKVKSDLPINPDRKFQADPRRGRITDPTPEPCVDSELVYYPPIPKSTYYNERRKFSSFDIL